MVNIDELLDKFSERIPLKFKSLSIECREFLKESLQSLLREQGLVTREEYDIQCQVLVRTRDKIAKLEALIDEMNQTK